LILLFAIALFTAWRYSKTSIDPDWAYFNLWGFTGSIYGRDFADCKTPLVHLWYLGLSKLVGRNIARVKFANHFLIGSVGALLYFITGDFMGALAYTVLVNSGWLLAFHGNVGQVPAALIALAFAYPPLAPWLWIVSVLYEPKLIFSFVVYAVLSGWGFTVLLIPAGLLGYLLFKDKQWFKWIWESSITIPMRMSKNRKGDFYKLFMPWFTSNSVLFLAPWLGLAVLAKPDFPYWLPALVYVLFIASGKVVRQNHFIPLIPFIAFSGMDYVLLLVMVDFASAGFYLGDIWLRFYPALADLNTEAEKAGEWLKEKTGTLYVNGIHSGIYIHALKPVPFGFAEQIEIREVAKERRATMIEEWKQSPPEWLVESRFPGMRLNTNGYKLMQTFGDNKIYKKAR
jgi:hypothetical protein